MAGSPWKDVPAKKRNGLTHQQMQAVDLFFGAANFNKSKALKLAGYAHPGSYSTFFQNPQVAAEVERRYAAMREKYDVSYERVVEELARVAFSNLTDFGKLQPDGTIVIDLEHASAAELAAIGEIVVEQYVEGSGEDAQKVKRVKIKTWNKLTALDQLMRHTGISRDRAVDAVADLAARISAGVRRVGAPEGKMIEGEVEDVED